MGHTNIKTTSIYTHLAGLKSSDMINPLDVITSKKTVDCSQEK